MVDYDAAVAAVQDPNADPILLAKIAYENPEFGANVAVNPRCYPGLKRWIAEFGDDRARETLAPPNRLSSLRLRRHSRSLWPPILTVSPPNRP